MAVDHTDHRGAEHEELGVVVRRLAGGQEVTDLLVAKRPVQVLARAVEPREGLFVEQAGQAVLLGDLLEDGHDQLLVVGRDVGALEHRGDLVLARGDLVVPCLDRHTQFVELALAVHHERQDEVRDGTEVVVPVSLLDDLCEQAKASVGHYAFLLADNGIENPDESFNLDDY